MEFFHMNKNEAGIRNTALNIQIDPFTHWWVHVLQVVLAHYKHPSTGSKESTKKGTWKKENIQHLFMWYVVI